MVSNFAIDTGMHVAQAAVANLYIFPDIASTVVARPRRKICCKTYILNSWKNSMVVC